ncbi:hypothetical protein SNEBB_004170 [Seison nebaliae]|nr:hypothetical protein SNEBB_004170 [Seison nebaliae]
MFTPEEANSTCSDFAAGPFRLTGRFRSKLSCVNSASNKNDSSKDPLNTNQNQLGKGSDFFRGKSVRISCRKSSSNNKNSSNRKQSATSGFTSSASFISGTCYDQGSLAASTIDNVIAIEDHYPPALDFFETKNKVAYGFASMFGTVIRSILTLLGLMNDREEESGPAHGLVITKGDYNPYRCYTMHYCEPKLVELNNGSYKKWQKSI